MSSALIRSSNSQSGNAGQPKRTPVPWTQSAKARDFVKNSIRHESLPVATVYSKADGPGGSAELTECRLWSPEWNRQITPEGDAFLEEAGCLGYTEDQSLAVLYVSKFDVRMARERLMKFRNIYIPILSAADQLIFQDLMDSNMRKKFSNFRNTKLAKVPVKDLVNYYYFQKLMSKRKNNTSYTLSRAALEQARARLTPEYLKEIRFNVYLKNTDSYESCSVCFKQSSETYRAGTEYLFCPACYHYYQKNKFLPPLVPVEPVTLPYTTPQGLFERAGAWGQENCTIQANSQQMSLLREHRRQAQRLTKIRQAGPTAAERTVLMDQIDAILSQENQDHGVPGVGAIDETEYIVLD
ncbi:hypothetical protein BV898_02541 [Hypsibius exemplaris]|uniref:Uncharacterized protein n=1 Tax=Hypsibius exemplaris TaxID=2072580 RepID=A0A1W0X7A2_HYPEX|nr:hypothetical protein BV898_02541 [Hypsibius exemplaris]